MPNAYEILSQEQFKPGDLVLLDFDDTVLIGTVAAHPDLANLLERLQNQGVICIVVTARKGQGEFGEVEKTENKLASLNLSFFLAENLFFDYSFPENIYYAKGVFYTPTVGLKSTKGHTAFTIIEALQNINQRRLDAHGFTKQCLARQIIFLDDWEDNLNAVRARLQSLETKDPQQYVLRTHLVRPSPLLVLDNDKSGYPKDLSTLTVEDCSYPVYILKDSQTNNKFSFKIYEELEDLQDELIADELYRALGCAVPGSIIINQMPLCMRREYSPSKRGMFRLARFVSPHQEQNPDTINVELAKQFLVDVLLANEAIASGNFKHLVLDENKVLYRIYSGKVLANTSSSSHFVDELYSWRDSQRNHHVEAVYTYLEQEDLIAQHAALLKNVNNLFKSLKQLSQIINPDKIKNLSRVLSARLYDLEIRLHRTPHPYARAYESLPARKNYNSASILILIKIGKNYWILLGERKGEGCYSDLGGLSDEHDADLFEVASREAYEETAGMINISASRLKASPYHDLIRESRQASYKYSRYSRYHRMFLVTHNYIDPEQILEAVQNSTEKNHKEHCEFIAVRVDMVLSAIENNQLCNFGGELSLECNIAQQKKIVLFPPMAAMLMQAPVIKHLQNLREGSPLGCTKTRSHAEVDYQSFKGQPRFSYPDTGDFLVKRKLTYENKESGNKESKSIEERIYPDPEADNQALVHNLTLTCPLNSDIKALKNKRNLKSLPDLKETQLMEHKKSTCLPTQSIAHLQGVLSTTIDDPEVLVSELICTPKDKIRRKVLPVAWVDEEIKKIFIDAIKKELEYPNHVVLYHATNSRIAFLYDIISMIRSLLALMDIQVLRAFDHIFKKIGNLEAYISNLEARLSSSGSICLSEEELHLFHNFALFANYKEPGSSSLYYFLKNISNSGCLNDNKIIYIAIGYILEGLGISSLLKKEFAKLFIDLYREHNCYLSARLYQFFIAEDMINEIAFLANPSSLLKKPILPSINAADKDKILPAMHALKRDPKAFLDAVRDATVEVVLISRPEFMVGGEFVKKNIYQSTPTPDSLKKDLTRLCQGIVQELLQKRQALDVLFYGSVTGQARLLPLQRKYAYMLQDLEGSYQKEIEFDQNFSTEILFWHMQSGNIVAFKRAFNVMPECFELLVAKTSDFRGLQKQSIFDCLIRHQQADFAKIFFESKYFSLPRLRKFLPDAIPYIFQYASKNVIKLLLRNNVFNHDFDFNHQFIKWFLTLTDEFREFTEELIVLLHAGFYDPELLMNPLVNDMSLFVWAMKNCDGANIVDAIFLNDNTHTFLFQVLDHPEYCTYMIQALSCGFPIDFWLDHEDCDFNFLSQTNKDGHNVLTYSLTLRRSSSLIYKILNHKHYSQELLMPSGGYQGSAMYWAEQCAKTWRHSDRPKDEFLEILLDYYPPELIMQMDEEGSSFFIRAAKNGYKDTIFKLLSNKNYPRDYILRPDTDGNNVLACALMNKNMQIVIILCKSAYKEELICQLDMEQRSYLLHFAKDLALLEEVVILLLKNNADYTILFDGTAFLEFDVDRIREKRTILVIEHASYLPDDLAKELHGILIQKDEWIELRQALETRCPWLLTSQSETRCNAEGLATYSIWQPSKNTHESESTCCCVTM